MKIIRRMAAVNRRKLPDDFELDIEKKVKKVYNITSPWFFSRI